MTKEQGIASCGCETYAFDTTGTPRCITCEIDEYTDKAVTDVLNKIESERQMLEVSSGGAHGGAEYVLCSIAGHAPDNSEWGDFDEIVDACDKTDALAVSRVLACLVERLAEARHNPKLMHALFLDLNVDGSRDNAERQIEFAAAVAREEGRTR